MAQKKKKYNFISVPDAILICRFCKDLVKEPKQCLSCNKLLCSDCVDQIGKEPCPHCSTKKPKFLLDLKSKITDLGTSYIPRHLSVFVMLHPIQMEEMFKIWE